MAAPSNRRVFFRQPMYLRINLRVSGVRAPVPATLVDLSGGGGMVTARTMLRAQVAVEFDLPREGQPHLRLPGKIRKVSYSPGDRSFKYAVEFETLDHETREALHRFITDEQRRTISVARRGDHGTVKPKLSRLQEQRAHRRIDVNIPVRISLVDVPGSMEAVAIDVSTGGCRILIEHVLRQEWEVVLRFTFPNDVLRAQQPADGRAASPFKELKVNARALPGIKQLRGKYIQSLVWEHPDPKITEEINRFVQAAQLAALRK
ncbi:MAG: PilZ domain-containing protein [Candidatus Aquilonibacter sp.]|jgi:c-di-GMP-binding flagellar brake protein YcgR